MVGHTHTRGSILFAVHFSPSRAGSCSVTEVLAHAQVPVIRQAFEVSQQGIPGPVFVELPIDLTWPAKEVIKTTESMMPRAGNLFSNVIRCCLDNNQTLGPGSPSPLGLLTSAPEDARPETTLDHPTLTRLNSLQVVPLQGSCQHLR